MMPFWGTIFATRRILDTMSQGAPLLYGVIGNPIHHSLSPAMHNTGFAHYGLAAVMLPWRIEPGSLPDFFQAMRLLNIRGSAVTLPHKEQALALADTASERARKAGSANLLILQDNTIHADNTDVPGFAAPLRRMDFPGDGTTALVLGAGGAARAAVVALQELGVGEIAITSPSGTRGDAIAEQFGIATIAWGDRGSIPAALVVNTTPIGMTGESEGETPYPAEFFAGRNGLAYDIIYTPRETRFLREAGTAGWRTLGGLEMFIAQGDCQFRQWTGKPLPPESGAAVRRALGWE